MQIDDRVKVLMGTMLRFKQTARPIACMAVACNGKEGGQHIGDCTDEQLYGSVTARKEYPRRLRVTPKGATQRDDQQAWPEMNNQRCKREEQGLRSVSIHSVPLTMPLTRALVSTCWVWVSRLAFERRSTPNCTIAA